MTTLDKRLDKLEAIADPKKTEPMIIYGHWTAEQCAVMNAKRNPVNNPLVLECRPISENEDQDEQS